MRFWLDTVVIRFGFVLVLQQLKVTQCGAALLRWGGVHCALADTSRKSIPGTHVDAGVSRMASA